MVAKTKTDRAVHHSLTFSMFENLISFLGKFVQLTPEDISTIEDKMVIKEYPKKYLLIEEGDIAQHLYFINKGLIHKYFYKGKEMITTDLVCEGTLTGSINSFLSGNPSHYYLQTLEITHVLSISKEALEELYKQDKKWQRIGRIVITHFLLQQEKKILDDIRYNIRERIVHFAQDFPSILNRVPQRRIASYLNIKPETFTRLKHLITETKKPTGPKKKEKSNE